MSQAPKPRKIMAPVEAHRQSHGKSIDFLKSVFNRVVLSMGPDCGHQPFPLDPPLNVMGSGPSGVTVGVQTEPADESRDSPVEVIPEPGGATTISLDSSSEEDTKEKVLLESLTMKSLISSMKQEKSDEEKNILHFLVMENLPLKTTERDLETDVFNLVDIDRKSLALYIKRSKTECSVQIYTNDMRQAQKILACNRKVVVGGRVLATRVGMVSS